MKHHRSADPREQAEASVLRNNLTYSLGQLRLLGLLGLAVVLARALMLALALTGADREQRLEALLHFCPWLLLLPFAVGLYLLGGGHRRLRRELPLLDGLHASLLPLALVCLLLLPLLTTYDWVTFQGVRQQAEIRSTEILEDPTAAPPQPLSPYQQRLFDSRTLLRADLMAVLSGLGLLLLQQQSVRAIGRHGLTPGQFFRASPAPPRRHHHHR